MRELSLCMALWLGVSSVSWAWNEQAVQVAPTTGKAVRTHSTRHINMAVHNATVLIVPGLVGGCTSLFIFSDEDPWTLATLMAAINKNLAFSLAYDVDQRGTWGDTGSCAITSVTFN